MKSRPKIVVVGGGLAGLTAAYRLEQRTGISVDIYEARKRLGGRVHTVYFSDGHEELGGKFFRDGGDALFARALIQEMKLDIDSYHADVTHRKYVYKGKIGTFYDLFKDTPPPTEETLKRLQNIAAKTSSFGETLDRFFAGNEILRHVMEIQMREYEGSDSHFLSNAYLDVFWNSYTENYQFCHYVKPRKKYYNDSIFGGNELLIHRLADRIQGKKHLDSPLRKVIQKKDGKISLYFKEGQVVEADYVVIAIPLTILKDIQIDLPLDQKMAFENIQYGTNSKILLPIHVGDDPTSEFSVTEDAVLWFNRERSVMTLYYGGKGGIFTPSQVEKIVEKEKKDLKLLFPSIVTFPPVVINWGREEYSKGSYSNWSPSQYDLMSDTSNILGETVLSIFRPLHNKIFFAGEHAAIDHSATMEGAIESGDRTARMLQRALAS